MTRIKLEARKPVQVVLYGLLHAQAAPTTDQAAQDTASALGAQQSERPPSHTNTLPFDATVKDISDALKGVL